MHISLTTPHEQDAKQCHFNSLTGLSTEFAFFYTGCYAIVTKNEKKEKDKAKNDMKYFSRKMGLWKCSKLHIHLA